MNDFRRRRCHRALANQTITDILDGSNSSTVLSSLVEQHATRAIYMDLIFKSRFIFVETVRRNSTKSSSIAQRRDHDRNPMVSAHLSLHRQAASEISSEMNNNTII